MTPPIPTSLTNDESPAPVLLRRRLRVLVDLEIRVHDITPAANLLRQQRAQDAGLPAPEPYGELEEYQRALLHALLDHPELLRLVLHRQALDEIAEGTFAEELRINIDDLDVLEPVLATLAPAVAAHFREARANEMTVENLEEYYEVFGASLLGAHIIDLAD